MPSRRRSLVGIASGLMFAERRAWESPRSHPRRKGFKMLLVIAAVLAVLWLLGFLVFHLGAIIHAVIVIAVIVAIFHFVRGRGARV
jgi:amino acid transporter